MNLDWLMQLMGHKPKPQPQCKFCEVDHYNECAEARFLMGMDPNTTWECPDGTHTDRVAAGRTG